MHTNHPDTNYLNRSGFKLRSAALSALLLSRVGRFKSWWFKHWF